MKIEMVEGQGSDTAVAESVFAAELQTTLEAAVERLGAAVEALDAAAERMQGQKGGNDVEALLERVLAAMESRHESEFERQLRAAEAEIVELKLRAGPTRPVGEMAQRKTVPAPVANLLAKQGVSLDHLHGEGVQGGALDAALGSLSLEQRIAVKAQLMRSGFVS